MDVAVVVLSRITRGLARPKRELVFEIMTFRALSVQLCVQHDACEAAGLSLCRVQALCTVRNKLSRGETMPPSTPRRRSRRIYVRARTDPQSAQLWWPAGQLRCLLLMAHLA